MPSTLIRWRTARKPHRCQFCRETIPAGARYVAASLPPSGAYGDVGNTTWWHAASHGENGDSCPSYWLVKPYVEYPEVLLEVADG